MDMTYIVTGATGFVGNNIIRKLIEAGKSVRGFGRSEKKYRQAFKGVEFPMYYGDTRNYEELAKIFEGEGPFTVIHTAAIVSIGNRKLDKDMRDINVNGTKNVLRLCKEKNVERLVHVSSIHAIPEKNVKGVISEVDSFDPALLVGKYAKTKAESSALVMAAVKEGLNAVIVHPTGIIGPDDYSDTHLTGMVLELNNGRIPAAVKGGYDFVDVRDVAEGALLAMEKGRTGQCYLLSGHYLTVKEMLNEVCPNLNRKPIKVTFPMWTARIFLPFLQLYFKLIGSRTLFTRYSLYTLRSNANITHQKATEELGYNPRPFSDTVKDTVDFLKAEGWIKDKRKK